MVSDRLVHLLEAAKSDTELQAALQSAATPDDVVRLAAERGITLSASDLPPPDSTDGAELSDEELRTVAGGTNAAWYWQTADEFCSTNGRLCTFYAPYCGT